MGVSVRRLPVLLESREKLTQVDSLRRLWPTKDAIIGQRRGNGRVVQYLSISSLARALTMVESGVSRSCRQHFAIRRTNSKVVNKADSVRKAGN